MTSLTGLGILSFPFPGTAVPGYRLFRPYGDWAQPRLEIVPFYRRLVAIRTVCRRQAPEGREEARICIAGLIPRAAFMPSLTGLGILSFSFSRHCRAGLQIVSSLRDWPSPGWR